MARYKETERLGVNTVEGIVLRELKWIFREQPIEDMGIDAQIERVDQGYPTGKIIGVQVKTGKSHFTEKADSLVYYGDLVHLDYWTNHSLPVLLIAHLPETNQTYWVQINNEVAIKTGKKWKVEIPKANIFGSNASKVLHEIFEGSPSQQKLRRLLIDESLMRHLEDGGKVSIGLEDWVNKSLGRSPVQVYIIDENGDEILSKEWNIFYTGYNISQVAQRLFPWASITIDEEFYELNQTDDGEDDLRLRVQRATEKDNGICEEDNKSIIYPYDNAVGEIDFYRLELKLNEIGKAFLIVSDHVQEKD